MIQIAILLLVAVAFAVADILRYRAGKPTYSTMIRGIDLSEPSIPWLIGAGMVLGCVAMAWGQPGVPWASGYLSGGLMWGLMVHICLNTH